jgi:hypothetical protein
MFDHMNERSFKRITLTRDENRLKFFFIGIIILMLIPMIGFDALYLINPWQFKYFAIVNGFNLLEALVITFIFLRLFCSLK